MTTLRECIQEMVKELQMDCDETDCLHETQLRCREVGEADEHVRSECIYTRQEIIRHILEPLLASVEENPNHASTENL